MIPECGELRTLFVSVCGTAREIRSCRPNVQTGQLRPIARRSQFEVSEESRFAHVPHVSREHGQHLFVGQPVLRPAGNGVKEILGAMSGMVRTYAQVGEQQLFATRMRASTIWFNRHEYGVDVFQRLGIVGLQNPSFLAHVIFVKYAETARLLLVGSSASPRLKRLRVLKARLRVQVERIENQ